MPAKAKSAEFVPAHTALKINWRVPLGKNNSAVNVELGAIVHWLPLITRPVVATDVLVKVNLFKDKNWLDSYNVMARVLSSKERQELRDILKALENNESASELEGYSLWRTSMLHKKVIAHVRIYMHTHIPAHTYIHTHIHAYTHINITHTRSAPIGKC